MFICRVTTLVKKLAPLGCRKIPEVPNLADTARKAMLVKTLTEIDWFFENIHIIKCPYIYNCVHDLDSQCSFLKVGDNNINGGMINALCTPIFQRRLKPGESREIICEEPLKGQFVSVIIPADYGVLNFCEVEVYGRRRKLCIDVEAFVWYGRV